MRLAPLLPLLALALTGCVSTGTGPGQESSTSSSGSSGASGGVRYSSGAGVDYRLPAAKKIPATRTVEQPRADAWSAMQTAAGKSSAWRVQAANAKGMTLTLAYKGNPEPYVDCGAVSSRVHDNGGGIKSYDFSAASAHERYELENDKGRYVVDRQMELDAKVQVKVSDAGKGRSSLRVKVFYALTKSQFVKRDGAAGGDLQNDTIRFETASHGAFMVGGKEGTVCRATGKLEHDILNLIN